MTTKKIVEEKQVPIIEERFSLTGKADKKNELGVWFSEDGGVVFEAKGEWAKAVVAFLEKHQ